MSIEGTFTPDLVIGVSLSPLSAKIGAHTSSPDGVVTEVFGGVFNRTGNICTTPHMCKSCIYKNTCGASTE